MIAREAIRTERLTLRPSEPEDFERAFDIQSNWNVTRMLRLPRFPPDRVEMAAWFEDHPREWAAGTAYRFALTVDGAMIGLADLDEIEGREGDLGYWLDEAAWGRGYASEAATALVSFAFGTAGLKRLRSGCFVENAASARVLERAGFRPVDKGMKFSRPRGCDVPCRGYVLVR